MAFGRNNTYANLFEQCLFNIRPTQRKGQQRLLEYRGLLCSSIASYANGGVAKRNAGRQTVLTK